MNSNEERVRWRAGVLRAGGVSAEVARSVARDDRIDLHELLALIENGCPEPLALRIVAPDDRLPLVRPHQEAER